MASRKQIDKMRNRSETIIGEAQKRICDTPENEVLRIFRDIPAEIPATSNYRRIVDTVLGDSEVVHEWLRNDKLRKKQHQAIVKLFLKDRHAEVVETGAAFVSRLQTNARVLLSESKHGIICFSWRAVEICLLMAQSHLALSDPEKGVANCTTGIDLCSIISKCTKDLSLKHLESLKKSKTNLLFLRGSTLFELGDLQGSIADLRACVAIGRMEGLDFNDIPCVTNLMISMARSKVGMPRPHYSLKEVRMWNKELGIKEFSNAALICLRCGARPSTSMCLKQCGRCRKQWFCSAACQRACWPAHKSSCFEDYKLLTGLPVSDRLAMLRRIEVDGYFEVTGVSGPAVVLRDESTGKLFESLSDQDVTFVDQFMNRLG